MAKYVCTICGYVHEGDSAPAQCPQCKAPAEKFKLVDESAEKVWADEHRVGIAKDLDPRVVEGLREKADREGYPEVAEAYKRIAFEEAEHAAKFAELLGEVVTPSTKKNLELRVEAEHGATQGKKDLATLAKELGYDAVHDTVHEMCKDEARHGCAFQGLLKRYF